MIVFSGYKHTDDRYLQLYLMEDDGHNLYRVTDNKTPNACINSIWSPDGQQILFEILWHGVYCIDINGTNLHRLAGTDDEDYPIDWLPDGRIILGHRRLTRDWAIYIMPGDSIKRQLFFSIHPYHHVAIAPTYQQVAFIDFATSDSELEDFLFRPGIGDTIYLADVNGAYHHPLLNDQRPKYNLSWSPDAKHLAFLCPGMKDRNYNYDSLYVIDADGTNLHWLSDVAPPEQGFVWSPDSHFLAFPDYHFSDNQIMGRAIYVTDINGLAKHHIADLDEDRSSLFEHKIVMPVWSPDSQSLLVGTHRSGGIQLNRILWDGSICQHLGQSHTQQIEVKLFSQP